MKILKYLVTLLLVVGCLPAHADIIQWTVRGNVTLFTGATQALPFQIATGEQFALTLTLDTSLFTTNGPNPTNVLYTGGFLEGTLTFANGSVPFTFAGSFASLQVINDRFNFTPSGITQTDALGATLSSQVVNNFTRVTTFDATRTESGAPAVLDSTAFPTGSEVESMFLAPSTTGFFFRTDIAGRYYTEVRGIVTSVEVSAVPLPAAAGLFSLALLSLGRLRRR